MKRIIMLGLVLLLMIMSGCGNRDTFESECYGNCIEANDCELWASASDLYEENEKGFRMCQQGCLNLCYGFNSTTS